MLSTATEACLYFSYLTHPARNWKGPIKQADFKVRILGRPAWRARVIRDPGIKVLPRPHKQKGSTYSWRFRNWKPSQDIRVYASDFDGPYLRLQTRYVDFGKQVMTRSLTVKVTEVYPGRKKRAPVVISEMALLAGNKNCGTAAVADATRTVTKPSVAKPNRRFVPKTPVKPSSRKRADVARSGFGCSCKVSGARGQGAGPVFLFLFVLGLTMVGLRRRG